MSDGEDSYVTDDRDTHSAHRRHRRRRLTLAWGASLLSKAMTFGVQFLAVPIVYHVLGQTGYAAYAAVTASAGLILTLNLGIGGSLVTPIARASTEGDKRRQAVLVQAGLYPLIALCLAGALVVIPLVALLPLRVLFGKVGTSGYPGLRTAAILAATVTLATVPLSAVTFLRQAYQEMHITSFIGAVANALLCIGLLFAAKRSISVAVFVGLFVVTPLIAQVVNLGAMLWQRRYLVRPVGTSSWQESRHLIADGIRFVAADFASMLLYQWPVYWIARTLPPSTSSWFAVCMQAVVLQISFAFGLMMPIWPSAADALARGDHEWINSTIKKGRILIVILGSCAFFVMLFLGRTLLDLWLHRAIPLPWPVRGLMGIYVMLAIWEFYHFMLALGFGRLREAATAIFLRSFVYALLLPLLSRVGGLTLVWCAMCCSILFWTAWRLPTLLRIRDPQPLCATS